MKKYLLLIILISLSAPFLIFGQTAPILKFSVGKVFVKSPGEKWQTLNPKIKISPEHTLKLEKKAYIKVQIEGRLYTLRGPQIIKVKELQQNRKNLSQFLKAMEFRQHFADAIIHAPQSTVGVRGYASETQTTIDWADDTPQVDENLHSVKEIQNAYIKGEYSKIINQLENKNSSRNLSHEEIFYLASAYFFEGEYQLSATQFAKITSPTTSSLSKTKAATALLLEANALYFISDYPKALQKLEQFRSQFPDFAEKIEIYKLLMESYLQIGNPKKAQEILAQAQKKFADSPLLNEMVERLRKQKIKKKP